jgi:O-antigen/teichoic acid export membrane protein
MARFGAAVGMALALGVVQVFVLPKRLDVETYGAYRIFLVYVAYLGALHVGVADGAFVRWVGRSTGEIRAEWTRVAPRLLAIESAIVVAALAGVLVLRPAIGIAVVAFAACALFANMATLSGYALQAACDFRGAGWVTVLPPALFALAAIALPLDVLGAVLAAYVASYGVAALIGARRVAVLRAVVPDESAAATGGSATPGAAPSLRALIQVGAPVLGANLAGGLSQFADRLLVSVSVPVASFALYGFASATMVAASGATQALSRVALSHAGRYAGDRRARFLAGFYDLIVVAFGAALAGVPLFEALVARVLPAYASALPIVRALVAGAPFWIALHVVISGTLQSYGFVRRQMAVEVGGAAFVFVACGAALATGQPLWAVAAAASGAAVVTWTSGTLVLARVLRAACGATNGVSSGAGRFALLAGAQGAALFVALYVADGWPWRTAAYVALAATPTAMAARSTWRRRSGEWR